MYRITFFNVDFFKWINNNIVDFEFQNLVVSAIYFPSLLFLIYRIWAFKNIDKNTKGNWTVLLIFVSIVTMPVYIWRKDDVFIKQNNALGS